MKADNTQRFYSLCLDVARVDDMAMMRLLTREGAGLAVLPPIAPRHGGVLLCGHREAPVPQSAGGPTFGNQTAQGRTVRRYTSLDFIELVSQQAGLLCVTLNALQSLDQG